MMVTEKTPDGIEWEWDAEADERGMFFWRAMAKPSGTSWTQMERDNWRRIKREAREQVAREMDDEGRQPTNT